MNFLAKIQTIVPETLNEISKYRRSVDLSKVHFLEFPPIQTEPFYENAITHCIQIYMGIIEKRNSHRPNIIGGGRRTECSTNWMLHDITQVCHFVDPSYEFHSIKPKIKFLGLVLFLEEDHYVAEDFLHLLALMQKRAAELCAKCNILSLGTYLKTFNYYTYTNINKVSDVLQSAGCRNRDPTKKKQKTFPIESTIIHCILANGMACTSVVHISFASN